MEICLHSINVIDHTLIYIVVYIVVMTNLISTLTSELSMIFLFSKHFFFFKIYLLIDSLLCWVFVSVLVLPVVAASGGYSSSRCAGLSLLWPLLLRSTGSRRAGSAVVAHGPSCSVACGIFPDQGANPCPLH